MPRLSGRTGTGRGPPNAQAGDSFGANVADRPYGKREPRTRQSTFATMIIRADRPFADPRSSVPSSPGQERSLHEPPTRQSSGRAEDRGAEPTSLAPPHSCREARKE